MRITGISAFNISSKNTFEQKRDASALNKSFIQLPMDTFNRQAADISFNANVITSQSKFKKLVRKRTMHCIYCNKVLVDEDSINQLQNRGVFNGPINKFVAQTKQYYKSMHKAHKTVFRIISSYAKRSPHTTLSQVMQDLYPSALKHLRNAQSPIFKRLQKASKQLPPEYKIKFDQFMRIQNYRLRDKPYINEFSGKEFNYKLMNMCKTIGNERLVNMMLLNSNYLTHPAFKNEELEIPEKLLFKIFNINIRHNRQNFKNLKDKLPQSKEIIMLHIIQNIKQIGQKLSRNDIIELCNKAQKEIFKIPVKVPFSNKSFRYDLNELLTGLPDKTLKRKMLDITKELPTSMENPYSFITKHATASSEKVGHNLLFPSIVTIEHMQTKFDKGKSVMGNYALSCAFDNNFVRSNRNMRAVLNRYNEDNPQKYFNEIFEVVRSGELLLEDVLMQVKTFEKQSGRKIDTSAITDLIEASKNNNNKSSAYRLSRDC